MDIRKLEKEISSPAIREIVSSLWDVVDRIQKKEIQPKQGGIEVAAHRHFLQAISLDWFYSKQKLELEQNPNKLVAHNVKREK